MVIETGARDLAMASIMLWILMLSVAGLFWVVRKAFLESVWTTNSLIMPGFADSSIMFFVSWSAAAMAYSSAVAVPVTLFSLPFFSTLVLILRVLAVSSWIEIEADQPTLPFLMEASVKAIAVDGLSVYSLVTESASIFTSSLSCGVSFALAFGRLVEMNVICRLSVSQGGQTELGIAVSSLWMYSWRRRMPNCFVQLVLLKRTGS